MAKTGYQGPVRSRQESAGKGINKIAICVLRVTAIPDRSSARYPTVAPCLASTTSLSNPVTTSYAHGFLNYAFNHAVTSDFPHFNQQT